MVTPSFWEVTLNLAEYFVNSLNLFALTLLFAIPLGLLISFGSMSKFKPLSYLVKTFVWIIRGTPLLLQLIIFYFGPGIVAALLEERGIYNEFVNFLWTWSAETEAITSAVVAFVINYACYFSEIYRGGIEGISHGQYEAGYVLGMTKSQIFFKVVLLQVIKRIIPPMSNEIITLVKDTSLARTIGYYELFFAAREYGRVGLLWPLFYAGAFYLAFSGILTLLFNYIEKKLSYFKS